MDMRIEFEAAMAKQLSSEGYSDFSIEMMFERGSDNEYRSIRVNGAYWGWRASRESLVVEFPDDGMEDCQREWGEGCKDTFDCGYNFSCAKHEQAIHEAGIRTK